MCMRKECNKKYFVFRTLCGKGVDPRNDYSTNLRLDQDTVKIFNTDLRLENVWNNVWSEVGELKEKSLNLGLNSKQGRFVWNFISKLLTFLEWVLDNPNNWLQWMSGKSLDQTKKFLILTQTFHCSRHNSRHFSLWCKATKMASFLVG